MQEIIFYKPLPSIQPCSVFVLNSFGCISFDISNISSFQPNTVKVPLIFEDAEVYIKSAILKKGIVLVSA